MRPLADVDTKARGDDSGVEIVRRVIDLNESGGGTCYARFFNPDILSWSVGKLVPDGSRIVYFATFFALLSKAPDGGEKADLFARFGYDHVRIVQDRLKELSEGFSLFSVFLDGTIPQFTGNARLLNAQGDIALYCAEDERLRGAMSVMGDLMDRGVRVCMEYYKGDGLVTLAEPITIDARRGIVVLDQGRVMQPPGDIAGGGPCQRAAVGIPSRPELDAVLGHGACPPEESGGISDDEAARMFIEEFGA